MMRAPAFRWHAATSLADAARALAEGGPGALLVAGGTDVVPAIKRRQYQPELLISLRRVAELQAVGEAGGGLRVGAGAILSELATHPQVHAFTALERAAGQVASPHIRNVATLGGNLCLDTRCNYYNQSLEWRRAIDFCMKAPAGSAIASPDGGTCWVAPGSPRCWAVSQTDCAPALIALGATLTLVSARGQRVMALADLYRDDGMTWLSRAADEIVAWVDVPRTPGLRSTYWKLRRRGSFDFPVLGVAAAVDLAGDVVSAARVVLGAVASRPLSVPTDQLVGQRLSDAVIDGFADEAARLAKPLDNTDFQLGWRKRVARAYVAGALRELRGDDPAALGVLARRMTALIPS